MWRKALWALFFVVAVAIATTVTAILAVATNAATNVAGRWPLGLEHIRLHPFAWMAGSAGAAILAALLLYSVQSRLERDKPHPDPVKFGRLPRAKDVDRLGTFGIHPAIPLQRPGRNSLDPDLPVYVPRDFDPQLRQMLESMRRSGGFVLLVGDSAAGKSRSAFEAAKAVLGRWRVLVPASAEQLNTAVADDRIPAGTIIVLDEIQEYLHEPGGLTVSTIQSLLSGRREVIIIGTIWPGRLARLLGTEMPSEQWDAVNQSRRILSAAQRVAVTPFSAAEQERARDRAGLDPRLAEVIGTEEAITQSLACRSELLQRWQLAEDPAGAAAISAAIDARRCGHPATIPAELLAALIPHYLTATQLAALTGDWLASALAWASLAVRPRTGVAPLVPVGSRAAEVDGFQVNDMLVEQAARETGHPVPETSWWTLADQAAEDTCLSIAIAALQQSRRPVALRALGRAATAGRSPAMLLLSIVRYETGRKKEALRWVRRSIEAGNSDAMVVLGQFEAAAGRRDEATRWYEAAAEAGNGGGMNRLALRARDAGDLATFESWATRAVAAGHVDALNSLGVAKLDSGDEDEAMVFFRRGAEAGVATAMANLAGIEKKRGNDDEARALYRQAFENGIGDVAHDLAHLVDDDAETLRLVEFGAEQGDVGAMAHLGEMLAKQGRAEEGEKWLRRAVKRGHTGAMYGLAAGFEDRGDDAQAERWYRRALDAGFTEAGIPLTTLLRRRGDWPAVEELARRLAEDGDSSGMNSLGNVLMKRGEKAEAEQWYARAADAENEAAMLNLGRMRFWRGRFRDGWRLMRTGARIRADLIMKKSRKRG
ncbi:tetratricopeptide repeat protein [Actinoplanes sp. NPDC026619]|uniref:SEL1-like repeat protein n=1 Tax=Actinoplanes sp. NPDC026619 TaxID=3155798 RepID=UPI0033F43D06